jgi:uncharacterized surface protein with fasciclin (FAS1) repeats
VTRLGLAALMLAVAALAGCASDGDADRDNPTPTSAPATTATPADTSLQTGSTVAAPTTTETGATTTTSVQPVIPTVPAADSVIAVIAEQPDLTILGELVESFVATGQGSVFTQARGLIVLAPTDEAMRELGEESLRALTDDPDALARWMASHVAIGAATIDELDGGGVVLNAAGQSLPVVRAGDVVRIGDNEVVEADLTAENGVVHVIAGTVVPVS